MAAAAQFFGIATDIPLQRCIYRRGLRADGWTPL
jgi:hypothetical protein